MPDSADYFSLAAALARVHAAIDLEARPALPDHDPHWVPQRCTARDDHDNRCILEAGHAGRCEMGELVDEETGRLLR